MSEGKITAATVVPGLERRLKAEVAGEVMFDRFSRGRYATDASHYQIMPLGVVVPRSVAEAERASLQQQNLYLQEEIKSVHNFEEIVGRSPALLAVLDKVSRVAPTDATALITGETGTGKELIARAIHSHGRRAAKPLINAEKRGPKPTYNLDTPTPCFPRKAPDRCR